MTTLALNASIYGSELSNAKLGDGPNNARIEFLDEGMYFIFYNGHVYATDKLYHLMNCPCQEQED